MLPLLEQGCIQCLAHTANSVVCAVDTEATPGRAKDTPTVLKGWAVWYKGEEPLGPVNPPDEADEMVRTEAAIYEALGKHHRILDYLGLEVAVLKGAGPKPWAWALGLERAPGGINLRNYLYAHPASPPGLRNQLALAWQFAEGLAYVHARGVAWVDVSTRNALLFGEWHLKICDFGLSMRYEDHPRRLWAAELRYKPPGPDAPSHLRDDIQVDVIHREIYALGSAIYEFTEWRVPYGSEYDVPREEVEQMMIAGKYPEISAGNPAEGIILRCWAYKYESAQQVVRDLKTLLDANLLSRGTPPRARSCTK